MGRTKKERTNFRGVRREGARHDIIPETFSSSPFGLRPPFCAQLCHASIPSALSTPHYGVQLLLVFGSSNAATHIFSDQTEDKHSLTKGGPLDSMPLDTSFRAGPVSTVVEARST